MKNSIIYILILSTILSTGCFKERIELDLNSTNQKLVIDAWITDLEEEQFVQLSLTSDYFDSFEPTYINDATVSISNSIENISLISIGDGKYALPNTWTGIIEDAYVLKVVYNSETYEASSIMSPMPEIENIRFVPYEEDSLTLYDVYFDFWENEGEGDGYYAVDYKKGTANGDTLFNGGFTNDDFVDGLYFRDVSVTEDGHNIGDTVILDTYSIGKDAADFLQAIGNEVFRDGLFDPAPVNVKSNISNGALGYFIIGGARRFEVVVE